jgi:hypothetical protein
MHRITEITTKYRNHTKKITEITDKVTEFTSEYARLCVSHLANFIKIGVDFKKLWQ